MIGVSEERPLVSYVVTTYNIEKYVEEAVRCAFAQTYSPLEIVLSDDCSTDNTFEIMKKMAEEYQGPHTIVLNRNEKNLGIAKHMNKAYLELASGEIIVAAHGDDISLPERTEKSYEFLKQNPQVTAVSFSLDAFNDKGDYLKEHSAVVGSIHKYSFSTGGNIPAPSRAFYKRVMETFGPLNDDCPTEDELISFRALLLGENVFLPEHMVKYRKHEGSSSNPENFDKFPLEKILAQQDDDMKKAVSLNLITDEQRLVRYEEKYKSMCIRKQYRIYFANRDIKSLFALLKNPYLDNKTRAEYIYKHIKYMCHFE